MSRNISAIKGRLKTLNRILKSHYALVMEVGVEGLPNELPVKGESGEEYTVRRDLYNNMECYKINGVDEPVVVKIDAVEPSITMVVWSKYGRVIGEMTVNLGRIKKTEATAMSCTGSPTAGEPALKLIKDAIDAYLKEVRR